MNMPVRVAAVVNGHEEVNLPRVVEQELRAVPGVHPFMHPTFDSLDTETRYLPRDATSLIVIDAPSVGYNFSPLPEVLKGKPRVVLVAAQSAKNDQAPNNYSIPTTMSLKAGYVLQRPFKKGDLSAIVAGMVRQLPAQPPIPLRGLFSDKACTGIYYNGKPIDGLISHDRDILRFLIHNEGKLNAGNIGQLFCDQVQGIFSPDSAMRTLRNFSNRLDSVLRATTNGKYSVMSEIVAGEFRCCNIVKVPRANGPK